MLFEAGEWHHRCVWRYGTTTVCEMGS